MQAFSYLQRNIADKNYIRLIAIFGSLVVYLAISSINPYLPPLFGALLVSVYFVQKKEFTLFALVYLFIFEMDRGYYLFSGWLFLFFYLYYLTPFLESFVDCKKCVAAIGALMAYPLYYLFLEGVDAFLLKDSVVVSIFPVALYALFETLLASALE